MNGENVCPLEPGTFATQPTDGILIVLKYFCLVLWSVVLNVGRIAEIDGILKEYVPTYTWSSCNSKPNYSIAMLAFTSHKLTFLGRLPVVEQEDAAIF